MDYIAHGRHFWYNASYLAGVIFGTKPKYFRKCAETLFPNILTYAPVCDFKSAGQQVWALRLPLVSGRSRMWQGSPSSRSGCSGKATSVRRPAKKTMLHPFAKCNFPFTYLEIFVKTHFGNYGLPSPIPQYSSPYTPISHHTPQILPPRVVQRCCSF